MTTDFSRVVELLSNSHLFRTLNEAQLADLAQQFGETRLAENETLFEEGAEADSFYLVYEGQVKLTQKKGGKTRALANLVAGDYFGEEAFFTHRARSATVTAATDSIVLRMEYVRFANLIREFPHLKPNLKVSIASRRMARTKHWSWINPGEVIYVLVRKHTLYLIRNLILPVLALMIGIGIFIVLFFEFPLTQGTTVALLIGGAAILLPLLWVGWNTLDWSNDYYFVTNQRVVWVEIVAGLYESRQEAPLTTILSVGVETDQFGRVWGYGNVIVRTFTGPIPLRHVDHPNQLASMVEEHWRRSKMTAQKDDAAAMEQAIRSKLAMAPGAEDQTAQKPKPRTAAKPPEKISFFKALFSNIFQVRFDVGEVVTYRKHWFVLIENTWVQGFLFAAILVALIGRLVNWYTFLTLGGVVVLSMVSLLIVFLWWLYNYIDWHNDIYQVTADQIVDIERKPFGDEDKKTAPLENILSIEYERLGAGGIIFNYGSVYIKVGSTTFKFDHVFDPSQVQQDIFRRKLERENKRKKAEKDAERDRLASWIATYHRNYSGTVPPMPPPSAGVTGENNKQDAQAQNAEDESGKEGEDLNGFGWIE